MTSAQMNGANNRATDDRAMFHDLAQYTAAAMLVASMPAGQDHDSETQHRFDLIMRQLSQMQQVLHEGLQHSDEDETTNVVELVRECVEASVARPHVDLVLKTSRVEVEGHHVALRRAINNLLDNAFRAIRGEGKVVVRVLEAGDRVCVEVQDTGVGFGRLRSGRGLGMVSVADAVSSYNGALEIFSGPGPGTLVRLKLPRRGS